MLENRRSIFFISMVLAFSFLSVSVISGQTSSGVQVGEPLHLWLKRSPAQDLTTLSFYPIQVDDTVSSDPKFRHSLGPKGQENSKLTAYFPTHPDSNFLQFEYNSTLVGAYNFTISAILPNNASDIEFRLKVTLAFAQVRGSDLDVEYSFVILGQADSNRKTYTGDIEIDKDRLDRFDGEKGGRMKLTIERVDNIDTDVLLYLGYGGRTCSMDLPYSKYRYEPIKEEEDGFDWTILIIILFGSLVIIILVFMAFGLIGGKKEKDDTDEPPKRTRYRSERR